MNLKELFAQCRKQVLGGEKALCYILIKAFLSSLVHTVMVPLIVVEP